MCFWFSFTAVTSELNWKTFPAENITVRIAIRIPIPSIERLGRLFSWECKWIIVPVTPLGRNSSVINDMSYSTRSHTRVSSSVSTTYIYIYIYIYSFLTAVLSGCELTWGLILRFRDITLMYILLIYVFCNMDSLSLSLSGFKRYILELWIHGYLII